MALADALVLTVSVTVRVNTSQDLISSLQAIVAKHRGRITGVSPAEARFRFRQNGLPNPIYRKNADCIASVVLLWPGMIASFASTYIMWKSHQHDDEFGPKSSKKKASKGEEMSIEMPATTPKPASTDASTQLPPYPSS
jgi:hypothetical protein